MRACLIAITVLTAFLLAGAPGVAAQRNSTFEGVIYRSSGHDGVHFSVQLKNGTTVLLPDEPVSDYDNGTVPILATIRVTCTLAGWRAEGLVANCTDLSPVTVLATQSASASDFKLTAFTRETTTGVSFAYTLALVSVADGDGCTGFTQPVTAQEVTQALRDTNDLITECSYRKMTINPRQLTVQPVTLPCTPDVRSALLTCDDEALRALGTRALGSPTIRVGLFHIGMVLPAGSACERQWSALAQIGAPFTWYTPTDYGIKRAGTIKQELLHNFGIYHGSVDTTTVCACEGQANCACHSEYGDYSTPMGRGDACLSAPESYRLNWATAVASLDATSLEVAQQSTFQVPALHSTPTNVVLVKTTWLTPYDKNLYFSLRVKAGADRLLNDTFNGLVSVHTTLQAIDAVTSNENIGVHFLQTIKPSTEAVLDQFKLVVRAGALSGTTISLTLCRYQTDARECRARSPPPSPPPPRAPAACTDLAEYCAYWDGQGYCDATSIYAPYMYDNCQRTCGKCGRSNCEDQDALCDLYVKAYGCRGTDNFYKWVRDTCSKSCKTCGTAAAATVAAAGQRCVDLSSSCDVFKARFTCKPKLNKAAVWAKANCQATCELCPVTANGAALADQPPLGCATGYDVVGATTLSTRRNLNLTACWDLCYDTNDCFLLSHDASTNTCVLRTTLADAADNATFDVVANASRSLCLVGTDRSRSAPELLQWFYCTDGLDIAGSLVSIQANLTELQCARACNASATCRLYTLLEDGSCVLKANPFSGDYGSNVLSDQVTRSCVQTLYTTPEDSASRRRRALVADAVADAAVPRPLRRTLMLDARSP